MFDIAAIGSTVRDERKAIGLRQEELAAASGVGLRFLVELERGKPTVQMGKVLDVFAALCCELQIPKPDGAIATGHSPGASKAKDE